MTATSIDSTTARHPIRVVSSRTGIAPTLLRAWERRYGVVSPGRSDGGQRLYSDEDVDRLVLLKRVTDGGRAIRHVAGLDTDRLREILREDRAARSPVGGGDVAVDDRIAAALATAWEAVETMDAEALETELKRAVVTLGSATFTDQLVGPLLHTIGQRWTEGRMRPAHEHVASEVVKRVLHWMLEPARSDGGGPTAVVGTLAGELHGLGALLAGATAALEGWQVTFLGEDLPPEEFALAAETVSARVVGISTVNPVASDGIVGQLLDLLERVDDGVTVIVGGASAGAVREAVGDARLALVSSMAEFRTELRRVAGT